MCCFRRPIRGGVVIRITTGFASLHPWLHSVAPFGAKEPDAAGLKGADCKLLSRPRQHLLLLNFQSPLAIPAFAPDA